MSNDKKQQNKQEKDTEEVLIEWMITEYDWHEKSTNWYVGYVFVATATLLYSFLSNNFLFALIVVLVSVIIIFRGQLPRKIRFQINDEGLQVGKDFYDFDEIKDFSIVYKPRQEIKKLYFEFQNVFKHRLSIPLDNVNPLVVRDILLKYLPEDPERVDEPISEKFSKFFKI